LSTLRSVSAPDAGSESAGLDRVTRVVDEREGLVLLDHTRTGIGVGHVEEHRLQGHAGVACRIGNERGSSIASPEFAPVVTAVRVRGVRSKIRETEVEVGLVEPAVDFHHLARRVLRCG
jgi:hypothetical protein